MPKKPFIVWNKPPHWTCSYTKFKWLTYECACVCVYVTINVNFHDNTKTRTTQNWKKANIKLKTKNINQTNSPHPFVLLSKKIEILFQKVALKLHFIGLFAVYCNKHNLPLPTSNKSYVNSSHNKISTLFCFSLNVRCFWRSIFCLFITADYW